MFEVADLALVNFSRKLIAHKIYSIEYIAKVVLGILRCNC